MLKPILFTSLVSFFSPLWAEPATTAQHTTPRYTMPQYRASPSQNQSQEDIQNTINTNKQLVSTTYKEQQSADFEYLACSRDLRTVLTQNMSFFQKIKLGFVPSLVFKLSDEASPELRTQYLNTLRTCEHKKNNYKQARESYRQAQLSYLNTLKVFNQSHLPSVRQRFIENQREYIKLLYRRTNNVPIRFSVIFWTQEYATELMHLKQIHPKAYEDFVARIQKQGWPIY